MVRNVYFPCEKKKKKMTWLKMTTILCVLKQLRRACDCRRDSIFGQE